MQEQEQYMKVMQNVIEATRKEKIQTSEELMKTLIHELRSIVRGNDKNQEVSSSSFPY